MKIKIIFLFVLIIFISVFNMNCNSNGELKGEFSLIEVSGIGIRFTDNTGSIQGSSVYAKAIIKSNNLVGATITSWSFKIYSNDSIVIEITDQNYNNLGYSINLRNVPVSEHITGWVDIAAPIISYDVYNGSIPNRIKFDCTLSDDNGNELNLSSVITSSYTFVVE